MGRDKEEKKRLSEELESVKSELATEKSKSSELGSQVAKMNQIISASQEALQQEQKNVELLKEAKVELLKEAKNQKVEQLKEAKESGLVPIEVGMGMSVGWDQEKKEKKGEVDIRRWISSPARTVSVTSTR